MSVDTDAKDMDLALITCKVQVLDAVILPVSVREYVAISTMSNQIARQNI